MRFIIFICFFTAGNLFAQVAPPQAFNYSGVARNASSGPITNQTIGIQLSILKGSPVSGAVVYKENHFTNTDAAGLFSLSVGTGAVQTGTFAIIDWSNDTYYLKVGLDATGGTNFVTMGTTQLLSVPYALYAKNAGSIAGSTDRDTSPTNELQTLSIRNDTIFLTNGGFVKLPAGSGGSGGALILPALTTGAATNISSNSATISVTISSLGTAALTDRGVCYSTTSGTCLVKLSAGGTSTGTFTIPLTNASKDTLSLVPNTLYYARAYATTENGITAFGNEVSFRTLAVGQAGQGGGIVFFDKGVMSNGWRYLEASAVKDSLISTAWDWGCSGTLIGTSTAMGTGNANTSAIVSGCATAGIPARYCSDLVTGGKSDWFYPSFIEAKILAINLSIPSSRIITTSSESSATTFLLYGIPLPNNNIPKSGSFAGTIIIGYVWPIRAF